MHGVPSALGCRAYLSAGREVGALYVERLAIFVSYIQSPFRSFVQKTAFLLVGTPLGSSYGFVKGKRKFWRTCDPVGIAAMLDSCTVASIF